MKTNVIENNSFKDDVLLGRDAIQKFRLNCDYKGNVTQTPPEIINSDNEIPMINWNENIPVELFEAKTSHLDYVK